MISTLTYFHGIVAGMYMMACLVIAVVRWFHMCKPCDRNPDYFYPGRKAVTIIYLTSLFLIPYILFPETNGTWLLVKAYFLPMLLYFLAILLFSFLSVTSEIIIIPYSLNVPPFSDICVRTPSLIIYASPRSSSLPSLMKR